MEIVKLEAEVDIEGDEIRVKPVQDPWYDIALWMEAMAFMTHQAAKYREWDEDKMIEYVHNYLKNAVPKYRIKLDPTHQG